MFSAKKTGDSLEMLFYDDIGEGYFGSGITSKAVVQELNAAGDVSTINVRLNSPGGDVFDGFAIFNALKRHEARVVVDVDALAASIASVIAMAGDDIRIAPNAMMMIHNPWTIAAGDSREMRRTAELLDQIQSNLVQAYVDVTGVEGSVIADAMDAETWYTAEESVSAGLAHSVSETELAIAASAFDPNRFGFKNTPKQLVAKESGRKPTAKESYTWQVEANRRRLQLMKKA